MGRLILFIRWGVPALFILFGVVTGLLYSHLLPEGKENAILLISKISDHTRYNAYSVLAVILMYTYVGLFGRSAKPIHWARNIFAYGLPWFAFGFALRFFGAAFGFLISAQEVEGSMQALLASMTVFFIVSIQWGVLAYPTFKGKITDKEEVFRFYIAPTVILIAIGVGFVEYAV